MSGGISAIFGTLALLGFLAFIAGIGLVVVAASQGRPVRGGVMLGIIGLISGVLLSIISQGILVVQPGEVAVVFQTINGTLEEEPRGSGTHIIIPILQEATIYTVEQQEYTMSGESREGALQGNDEISARTNDGQEVKLDVTVIFNVNPTEADKIHRNWRNRYVNEFVRPTVRSIVRSEVANYRAEAIYGTERSTLEAQIEDAIALEFTEEGLDLSNFLIRELNFTDDFSQAIERKEIEEQQLQRARTEAQRRETEAQGEANAAIERARGEAEAVRVNAAAQADALRVISEQLAANPLLIQYEYIRNLSDNVNMAIIPSNSPFLFDFNSLEGLPAANADFTAPDVPEVQGLEDTSEDTSSDGG